nr:MAG TPA: hypothetical protein [Caudoviricetes sp.]
MLRRPTYSLESVLIMNSLRKKLSASSTAQALVSNAMMYGEEKGRDINRFRFSMHGMKMVSGRSLPSAQFFEDLRSVFAEMGWSMINMPDGDFAFIQTAKIEVWPRVGYGRLAEALSTSDPEVAIEMLFVKHLPDFESELSL